MKIFSHLLAKVLITTSAVSFASQTTSNVSGYTRLITTSRLEATQKKSLSDRLSSPVPNALSERSGQFVNGTTTVDLRKSISVTTQPNLPLRLNLASDPAWLWMWMLMLGFDWIAM